MPASTTPRRPESGKQQRAEQTRAAMIDETVRCIFEEGFAAPSVRHITDRAGLTWGVVQYHFGDATGLLMAVVDQGLGELVAALEQALAGLPAELPRDQRVSEVIEAVWQAFSSPVSRAAFEILIATRTGRSRDANKHLEQVRSRLTDLGEHLGSGLEAPHAAEIGNLIWSTLRGIVVAQLTSPAPMDSPRDRQTLAAVITAYIDAHTPDDPRIQDQDLTS